MRGRALAARGVGIISALLVFGVACQEQEALKQEDILLEMRQIRARPSAQNLVVSFGPGQGGVSAQDMKQLWARHPEWTREQALDAAIRQELIWQSWDGEELGDVPWQSLRFARKRGLVDAWIDKEVIATTSDEVDEAAITVEVNRQAASRARPAGYLASHLLVLVPEGADEAKQDAAKAALVTLEARVEPDSEQGVTASDLLRTLAGLDGERIDGFDVAVNAGMKFPLQPTPAEMMPEGWLSVVPEFADGAKRVVADRGFGVLSEPVRTSLGWHTIVVHERFERQDPDREFIERVLRGAVRDRIRQNALLERTEALYAIYPWSSDPGALDEELTASAPPGAADTSAEQQP